MFETTVYIFIHGLSVCVCVCALGNLVGNVCVACREFSLTLTGERSRQGRERESPSELTAKPVSQHFLMRPGTCPEARKEEEREKKLFMQFS